MTVTRKLRALRRISTDKRPRVQERHWAHFVSAIRLSKSSPSRTMTPKPAAGLPTEVVNDKGRSHQQSQILFLRGIEFRAETVLSRSASANTDFWSRLSLHKFRISRSSTPDD